MSTKYQPVTWSPFHTNILDHIGSERLILPDGTPVQLHHGTANFILTIAGRPFISSDNTTISYIMNSYEVGLKG